MICLDDATLDDFVHGRLAGETLSRAEEHLAGCDDCSAVVSVLAKGEEDLARGTKVGRHVVIEPLGRGAMGSVYLASDPELDRKVALKVVRPGSSPERSIREAQA